MDLESLHKAVDEWAVKQTKFTISTTTHNSATVVGKVPVTDIEPEIIESPAKVLPVGKRVVRTKTSGDRVYYIDEDKKSRQWVANPDVLTSLGFDMNDVTEVDDSELIKYQMGPALYRVSE